MCGNLPDFSGPLAAFNGLALAEGGGGDRTFRLFGRRFAWISPDIEILPNAIDLESYPFRWRKRAQASLVGYGPSTIYMIRSSPSGRLLC
jgi:hypothetical protein